MDSSHQTNNQEPPEEKGSIGNLASTPKPPQPSPASLNKIATQNPNSFKNNLLAFLSLFIIAGIIGIILFLYIQNTTNTKQAVNNSPNSKRVTIGAALPKPENCLNQTVYKSIDEALKEATKACILDLSFNNLTSLPSSVNKLSNLNTIYLTRNKLTEFPKALYSLKKLVRIDINGNQLTKFPDGLETFVYLQQLNLSDNNISQVDNGSKIPLSMRNLLLTGNRLHKASIDKLGKINPNLTITLIATGGQILSTPTPAIPHR